MLFLMFAFGWAFCHIVYTGIYLAFSFLIVHEGSEEGPRTIWT